MAVNKYTVVISQRTAEMLVSHVRFLAQVSESAANNLIDEFTRKANSLDTNPNRCPWLDDPMIPKQKYRKLLFAKRYLLLFQVFENTVSIDAMVDCRQDYRWML